MGDGVPRWSLRFRNLVILTKGGYREEDGGMNTHQFRWTRNGGWDTPPLSVADAGLVLVFSSSEYFRTPECYDHLRSVFPTADILGCSSSGSITGTQIHDDTVEITAVTFERGHTKVVWMDVPAGEDQAGWSRDLVEKLERRDLSHVFVLSDGLTVNGSELARGLVTLGVPVTGGLAGDGVEFGSTWVMANGPAAQHRVALLGLYGVTVTSGCYAGWREFGEESLVTRSDGNVVYEVDYEPALRVYTRYLGELAKFLPGSGLVFPLSVRATLEDEPVIRTLLAVDQKEQSLTFAGDVPQGSFCRLMGTEVDRLIDSSGKAADAAMMGGKPEHALCLVVSCVGRRLVMGQMTERELQAVQKRLSPTAVMTGFYSYGELAPFRNTEVCRLHNQTMTITSICE